MSTSRIERMHDWLETIRSDLRQRDEDGLARQLHIVEPDGRMVRRDGRQLINLASNDYLALSQHPHLRAAARQAIDQFGVGAGASRLVTGHQPLHARVEARFAQFKHAEAALLFPTGYMANLAVLTTLARPGDLICIDKLCHASLIDAARASGATVRIYPHLNHDKLERLLKRGASQHGERGYGDWGLGIGRKPIATVNAQNNSTQPPIPNPQPRTLIVTDTIFSMDGDVANLPRLTELAARYGAITVVDEAHATGVLGETGAGLCEAQHVADRVDVVISTASKALGGLGGVVTARREVVDTLINFARPFIYTTAVPPAQAAALQAALDVVRDEPWRRQRVQQLAKRVRDALGVATSNANASGSPSNGSNLWADVTPIIPVIVGSPAAAIDLAEHLASHGFHAPAIRPPTVAPMTARVRLSLRADLEDADIDRLIAAIRSAPCVMHNM